MLTCIPDILDWTEIKKIRAFFAGLEIQPRLEPTCPS